MKNVKIFTTKTCHFCKDVKNLLDEKKVSYTTIDVGEDIKARKEMVELSGQMGVPVTIINGTVIVGFNKSKLEEALDVK